MSAFNITLALPQARGADASSGKPVDPDGGDEASGNRFADAFRDIGREISDFGRSAAGSDTTATDASATAEAAAGDSPLQTLADALASAGKSRTPIAAGDSAGRPADGRDAATANDGTAANLLSQAGKPTRSAAHPATRQNLAATAARLLSAADAAKAQAAQDQAAQDQQDLAGTETAADAATAQISLDSATAETAATERRAADKSAETAPRRLPGNQALTALLFGRTDADEPAASTEHTASSKAGAAAETTAQDVSAQDAASAELALPNAASQQLAMPLPLPLPPVAVPTASTETGGEPAATGREPLGGTAAAAEAASAAQPMRITILSRETHFAPIRTLALNGASAPSPANAASAAGGAAAADPAAAEPARTIGADPRTAATAASARALAGAASTSAATRAATPAKGTTTPDSGAPGTETASETEGTERITPRTPGRDTVRSTESRQAGRTREEETGSVRTGSTSAKDADATGAHATAEAAATEEAPVTGVAAIGGSSLPAAPAPALATLRQIGAAIAAEAGTMGATSSVEGPTANLIAGPVRLLDIQLSPDDLGTVNVRMRLSSNGLEIRLRASNAETAKMLERDQTALLDLLAASGITADSITIVGGDGAGLAQLTGQDAGRPFAAPQPAAGDTETPRDQNGREQSGRGSEDDRQKGQSRDDQARSPGRAFDLGGGFRV